MMMNNWLRLATVQLTLDCFRNAASLFVLCRIKTLIWFSLINKMFMTRKFPLHCLHAFQRGRFWLHSNELWSLTAVKCRNFCGRVLRLTCDYRQPVDLQLWARPVQGGVTDSQLVQLERCSEPDRPMRTCRCACRSLLSLEAYFLLTLIIKQNLSNKHRGLMWVHTHGFR